MEIKVDVRSEGIESSYVVTSFSSGKNVLERADYRIISLQENAGLRVKQGAKAYVSLNGNWVREGAIYVPKKGIYLTKRSPIMQNPSHSTNCHRRGREYYLTDEQVESSLEGAARLCPEVIPTRRFNEHPVTLYAFGEEAERYGHFLESVGIEQVPVWLANLGEKPFATQIWFHWLFGGRAALGCGVRDFGPDNIVRGIKNAS